MPKLLVIDKCNDCPYYDNTYYTFQQECSKLYRETDPDFIPDDCPLTELPKFKGLPENP